MTKVYMNIRCKEDELDVQFSLDYQKDTKELSFILNKNLNVTSVYCDDIKVEFILGKEFTPTFRQLSQEYIVKIPQNNKGKFKVNYSGKINGWLNCIEEDVIALSMYSVWNPQFIMPETSDAIVSLKGFSDYIVIKGDYDEKAKVWTYGNKGFDDCNILALKKSSVKVINDKKCNVYWFDKSEDEAASIINECFENTLAYYSNVLYNPISLNHFDVVSISRKERCGAYFRKELIVAGKLSFIGDPNISIHTEINYLFGHELAHQWCTGADYDSWEDWLNETTAEWSAILYAMENDYWDIVRLSMKFKMDKANELPIIKSEDGSRPNGVHNRGTLLFYDIYVMYGKQAVVELCRIFVNLKIKTTEEFMIMVKDRLGDEIHDYILSELTSKKDEYIEGTYKKIWK